MQTAQPDYDTWCRAEFNFCKHGIVVLYIIEIFSESADSILEIIDVLWDTKVTLVTAVDCPSLKSMRFHNVGRFDFSGCPNLEYLDCDYYKGEILYLTALPELKSLQCLWGEAVAIDLSKSPGILSLDLCGSKMNTLKVCNHTRLELCVLIIVIIWSLRQGCGWKKNWGAMIQIFSASINTAVCCHKLW